MSTAAALATSATEPCLACANLQTRVEMLEVAILGRVTADWGITGAESGEILADACLNFDVTLDELVNGGKDHLTAQARFAVFWTVKKALGWSLPRIAKLTGRKDHSTVHHGLSRAIALRAADPLFKSATDQMLADFHFRKNS